MRYRLVRMMACVMHAVRSVLTHTRMRVVDPSMHACMRCSLICTTFSVRGTKGPAPASELCTPRPLGRGPRRRKPPPPPHVFDPENCRKRTKFRFQSFGNRRKDIVRYKKYLSYNALFLFSARISFRERRGDGCIAACMYACMHAVSFNAHDCKHAA